MKSKPLTVTLHMGGKQIESLTDEQADRMAKRLSEVVSRYYGNHLSEYAKLISKK